MMSREQHLEWAKQRAREYLDEGEWQNAVTSMLSDLNKHPDTANHSGKAIWLACHDEPSARAYIEGFR